MCEDIRIINFDIYILCNVPQFFHKVKAVVFESLFIYLLTPFNKLISYRMSNTE